MLTRCKKLIVILMLLVYAGQSVAAALMACTLHEAVADAANPAPAAQSADATAHAHHGHHDARHDGDAAPQHHAATSGSDATTQHTVATAPQHDDDCCGAIGCAMGGCSLHGAMTNSASMPNTAQPGALAFPTLHRLQPLAIVRFRPPIVA